MTDIRSLKKRVYYSQNREDLILHSFFHDVKNGFYVDVGAYDPDIDSVTKLFYIEGWSGINIEPQPNRHKRFLKKRERDINLNIGVSEKKGNLTLRSYNNQGLSTFKKELQNDYLDKERTEGTDTYQDIMVEVDRLDSIFKRHKVKEIDFMKIDVEGFEKNVILSNDWSLYRPHILCIESNHIVDDWRPTLKKNEYSLVFNDGLNDYYVDKRKLNKFKLNYVQDVVLGKGGGLRFDDFKTIEQLDRKLKKQAEIIYAADNELFEKEVQLKRMSEKLQRWYGIKGFLRHFKDAVVNRLKKHGK